MQSAPLRDEEAASLAALRRLEVLDSGPEAEFDALVRAASMVCGVPISLISLIDTERQWFKANIGLPGVSETPRDVAFCAHAVLGDELFEVPDAALDPRFADNPLVSGQPDIRFYAGAPVKLSDGSRIGTLCVIDRQPQRLTASQRQVLCELALAAAQALEGRRALREVQQASRQVAQSEARFRALSESVPIGVFEVDAQGSFTFANQRLLSIFGLRRGQALAWTDVVHPEDRASVSAIWAQTLAAPRDVEGQFRVQLSDGSVRHVRVLAKHQVDACGQLLAFVGTVQDISEMLAQQEALRTSQAFLDRTGRLAGVGGWELDLLKSKLYWSDETCRIHGLPPDYEPNLEEAIAFYAPESRPIIQKAVEAAIEEGKGFDLELRQVLRDGRSIWVRAVGGAEFEAGRVVRVVGAFQDLTERVNERIALQEAHSVARLATESGAIGIWVYDLVQGGLRWDAWMYRLYGLPPAEGLAPYDLWARHLHPEDRAAAEAAVQDALLGRHPFTTEFRIIWADGSVHHIRSSALITRDDGGRPLRMVGVNWDTTEHHRAQAELREAKQAAEAASQAKSQFLANMSHEIRTPMNAILGMLTLLRKTALSERQADYVVKTERASRALLGLLNEILDFSKVEAGKMSLDLQPMRPEQLLRDLAEIVAAAVGTKKLEVVFDIDPALSHAWLADAMRLQQVLVNLLGNAIKFTEKGEVVLRMRVTAQEAQSQQVLFEVRDSGIGIAPEHQARIFAGFTQAEASITRRFGGTGLGVAISQRLVALMGGELRLQSELGRGSCFEFTLSLQDAEPASAGQRLGLTSTGTSTPGPEPLAQRVLILDDHALSRGVLGRLWASQAWQVTLAASVDEALDLLSTPADRPLYQALCMDWRLLGLDGWQTLSRLREQGRLEAAALILLATAQEREQLAQWPTAEPAGFQGVLVKPVTALALAEIWAELSAPQAKPAALPASQTAAEKPLAGLRLLLVEDNPNNQQVACELLQDEGAQVQIAGDGQQALEALQARPQCFDLVLMDLQMPVMDGLTAARHVREVLGLRALPIVAMTANALPADRQACLAAGMNEHVGKPFDLAELLRVLRQQTGREALASPQSKHALPASWLQAAAQSGVDLPTALRRMGDKPAVYQRMLQNFVADLPALQSELNGYSQRHDPASARRLLHTVKGLAATLGVQALSRVAAQGEAQLGNAEADLAAVVAPVQRAMAEAQPSLKALATQMQDAEPPLGQGPGLASLRDLSKADQESLRRLLQQLLTLLGEFDLEALQLLAQLQAQFDAPLGARLQPLDEALARLEFAQACPLVQAWLDELRAP